jgi:O-antigen/teichoic acid export membrane protein
VASLCRPGRLLSRPVTNGDHETAVQTAVSHLFGRDMVYMVAWAAQLLMTALLTPVLTRLMLPSQYGRAMALNAVMEVQFVILGFGLYNGAQRAFARHDEDVARRVLTVATAMAVAGGAVFYVAGPWWSPLLGLGSFDAAVKLAVIWAVLNAVTKTPLGLVRARDQLRWFVGASFAQSIFAQILAVAFVLLEGRSARGYMLGQVVGQFVAVAVVLAVVRPRWVSRVDRALLTRLVRFSLSLLPASLAGFVIGDSDRLIIQAKLGGATLARYSVASNIGGFLAIALGSLAGIWVTRLFAIEDEHVLRDVVGVTRDGICQLAAGCSLVVAAVSPILLALWSPAGYKRHSLLLATTLVAVQAIPTAAGSVYSQAMIVHGRAKAVAAVAVSTAVLNVLLNFLLIPQFGINGSAAASLLDLTYWAAMYHWLLGAGRPGVRAGPGVVVLGLIALTIGSTALATHGWLLGLRVAAAVVATVFCWLFLLSLVRPARFTQIQNRLRFRVVP